MATRWIDTIDGKLQQAELRLSRLMQLERDARSVYARREQAARLCSQEGLPDLYRQKKRAEQAWDRVIEVSNAVMYQKTIVRQLREGWE